MRVAARATTRCALSPALVKHNQRKYPNCRFALAVLRLRYGPYSVTWGVHKLVVVRSLTTRGHTARLDRTPETRETPQTDDPMHTAQLTRLAVPDTKDSQTSERTVRAVTNTIANSQRNETVAPLTRHHHNGSLARTPRRSACAQTRHHRELPKDVFLLAV